eukprot:2425780-Rhodomonas_salina.1
MERSRDSAVSASSLQALGASACRSECSGRRFFFSAWKPNSNGLQASGWCLFFFISVLRKGAVHRAQRPAEAALSPPTRARKLSSRLSVDSDEVGRQVLPLLVRRRHWVVSAW